MEGYVYEYAVPFEYPASQEDVFAALTDPEALKTWFAEHVTVEPQTGGAYRFWGKHTYGTPSEADASQAITAFDPPNSLSFTWHIEGQDSEVTWVVKPEGDNTSKITVRHEFDQLPAIGRAKEMIDDLWRFHTGNLAFYLMGDQKIFRPDFDDPSPIVRHEIDIDAPPEKVFKALMEPEQIKQWFPAPEPVVDPKVGGEYSFGFTYEVDGETVPMPSMTILELVENQTLTMTWGDWRGDPNVPDQKIKWTLIDLGGRTRLLLEHSGFVRTVDVSDYPFGWLEFVQAIKSVSEAL
ncbi:MAG: SRPBCC family protein [Pseudomonadota bacterium]